MVLDTPEKQMTNSPRGYRRRIKDIVYHKQKRLLESYYILKAKKVSDTVEEYMRQFIHSASLSEKAIDILCILFSDLNPQLYDFSSDEKISFLRLIHTELFGTERVERINTPPVCFTQARLGRSRDNTVQDEDICIVEKDYSIDTDSSDKYDL